MKVRIEIEQLIQCMHDADPRKKGWIAWLEKQGEQTDKIDVTEALYEHIRNACACIEDAITCDNAKDMKDYISQADYDVKSALDMIKKQGENADVILAEMRGEIKPKFHEGDWISGYYTNYRVTAINSKGYVVEDTDGNKINILFENEKFHHLWTIQDAKEGDVLMSRAPFIYGKQCPYGGLNWFNDKFIKASNFIFTDSPVHPATKEQRDLLFEKMADAGYTFDFEKKELKKIEQKPTEWSEEDGVIYAELIKFFEAMLNCLATEERHNENRKWLNWLKSLKQRIGG